MYQSKKYYYKHESINNEKCLVVWSCSLTDINNNRETAPYIYKVYELTDSSEGDRGIPPLYLLTAIIDMDVSY